MPWTIDDHKASAQEAIDRGLMRGDMAVLAEVPEPDQSTQHQARVMALSVLNEAAGPTAKLLVPWTPWAYKVDPPVEPPIEPPIEPPVDPPVEPPVEPPTTEWPVPFMSYPKSGPIKLNGVTGRVIENLSFEGIYRPGKPIMLENCHDIVIRNIDTRKCTMGLVYALNCTGIEIHHIRVENIAFEFIGRTLGDGWINENDCNLIQFDKVSDYYIHDIKGRYGNTEDVFSNYSCKNGRLERLHFEGATREDQPTSDGSKSTRWTSESGTGIILGDESGENVQVKDCIMVNAGQVLYQGMGNDQGYDNCIGIGEGRTDQPWNVGCSTWGQNSNLHFTNMRVKYLKSDGSENGNWWNSTPPDTTGSDFSDDDLNIEDYRVTL